MRLISINIMKNKHSFYIMDKETGGIISQSASFSNDKKGFDFLLIKLNLIQKILHLLV